MADTIYDVAIIGSGPAGYTAAIRAGQLGLKVALIESATVLGGTCLHVGCIPTKALLFNAELWDHLKHAAEYGIDNVDGRTLNWSAVQTRKTSIVDKHTKGLGFLMKKNKVTVISGYGRLTGAAKDGIHTIDLTATDGAKSEVKTKNIILATGSDAKMIFGLKPDDRILTNIEMLSVPQVPKSLIVIGAGAVGVEFSSIFRSFGTEVTLVEFLPRIMPPEDEEISKELTRVFKKRGIDINTGAKVEKIEKTETGVKVTWTSNGKSVEKEAEKVLVAVGRAGRIADVGIDKTKIELDRGFIKVGEAQETAEPGIYAIGDIVAGLPQLAHSGSMSGIVAVTKIAGRKYRSVRRDRVPACTYSEPQIGSVGLTEAQAKEKGLEIKVGKFPFAGNSKATIVGSHDGFVKIVADAKYGEILGVHIIGPQATELIAEAVAVMELEGTIDELMFTIHAHPTISEAMLDAYAAVEGMAINA
ncbi:MAG: dihydrolipoyl dehydrogenase [Terracidiphilus sp.]